MRIQMLGAAGGHVTGSGMLVETDEARLLVDFGQFQGGDEHPTLNRLPEGLDAKNLSAVVLVPRPPRPLRPPPSARQGRLPRARLRHRRDAGARRPRHARCREDPARRDQARRTQADREGEEEGPPGRAALHGEGRPSHHRTGPAPPLPPEEGHRPWRRAPPHRGRSPPRLGQCRADRGGCRAEEDHRRLGRPRASAAHRSCATPSPSPRPTPSSWSAPTAGRTHRPSPRPSRRPGPSSCGSSEPAVDVIVPTFALGRAQMLLYLLAEGFKAGLIPKVPVFLDSPMAIEATNITSRYTELFDEEALAFVKSGDFRRGMSTVQATASGTDSRRSTRSAGPCVILAGSGMCTAGRILHHLSHRPAQRAKRRSHRRLPGRGHPGPLPGGGSTQRRDLRRDDPGGRRGPHARRDERPRRPRGPHAMDVGPRLIEAQGHPHPR